MQRNNIAAEIEKVVIALTSRSFSRDKFLKELDRFYVAIEAAADTIPDFSEKQKFLNTVYEQFFQGFAAERADTLGIVYTPQEIVDFMLASVEEILKTEFGRSLGDPGVHVIVPSSAPAISWSISSAVCPRRGWSTNTGTSCKRMKYVDLSDRK